MLPYGLQRTEGLEHVQSSEDRICRERDGLSRPAYYFSGGLLPKRKRAGGEGMDQPVLLPGGLVDLDSGLHEELKGVAPECEMFAFDPSRHSEPGEQQRPTV